MTPEPLNLALHGGALLAATSSSKSSSSSPIFLIFLLVLFGVYFLWLRPKRNQMRAQQAQRSVAEVGDEIVTTGGIIGRLISMEGDRAEVEVAPGQNLTILRTAIGRRIDPIVPESADDDEELSDRDGHDHGAGESDPDGPAPRRWWPGSTGETPPGEPEGTN